MENSLYELAGGQTGIDNLAAAFYQRVFADTLLIPLFAHPDEDHVGRMALFLGEHMGGHAEHTRLRGGDETMAHIHEELRISDRQRDRWLEHMLAACAEVNMPDPFMEWFEPQLQHFAALAQHDSWA